MLKPPLGLRRHLIAATATLAACAATLIAAGPAGARYITLGSNLSPTPSMTTATNLQPKLHDGADTAVWNTTIGGKSQAIPQPAQIWAIKVKGCAEQEPGAAAPLTQIHFQSLTATGGGSMKVLASSSPYTFPTCGGSVTASTTTTYHPLFFCVKKGGYVDFNDEGGFVPPSSYTHGVPFLVMAPSHGSALDSFVLSGGTNNGDPFTFGSRPTPTSGFGVERNEQLLMQVTIGVGNDANGSCGGTADENAAGQIIGQVH
jgi:hypothetical protein